MSFVDIKGPRKLFPDLPFGNMDSEKVEARKSLLEPFLKVRHLLVWPFGLASGAQDISVLAIEHINSVPPVLCDQAGKLP